jgi:hypothetical protein
MEQLPAGIATKLAHTVVLGKNNIYRTVRSIRPIFSS